MDRQTQTTAAANPQITTVLLLQNPKAIFFFLFLCYFWIILFINQFVTELFKDIVILFAFGITLYLTYAALEYMYNTALRKKP
jgi:hypothetical protein